MQIKASQIRAMARPGAKIEDVFKLAFDWTNITDHVILREHEFMGSDGKRSFGIDCIDRNDGSGEPFYCWRPGDPLVVERVHHHIGYRITVRDDKTLRFEACVE